MKLEEVIERLKDDVKYADLCDIVDADCTICYIEDIETLLKSYEELKKENEELKAFLKRIEDKDLDEANIRAEAMLDMDKIWRNKIREKKAEIGKMANGNKVIENTIRYRVEMALLNDLLKEE